MKFSKPLDGELWKPIPGYEGLYEASNAGRIRSLDRFESREVVGLEKYIHEGGILKPRLHRQGYTMVALFKDGDRMDIMTHILIAKSFIDNSSNKKTVNHKNGIKNDNRAENLEWATQLENSHHAWNNGLITARLGEDNPSAKLTNDNVRKIKMSLKMGVKKMELAGMFNVSKSCIKGIASGRNWKQVKLLEA